LNPAVYINATGTFFPNAPVDNDNIEKVLGSYRGKPSRSRNIVLGSNQIRTSHYAIDPETRKPTHSNAEMTARAIENIFARNPDLSLESVNLLSVGTTAADLLAPAHGQMVHGLLPQMNGEVVTTAGVCCSSVAALKVAYLNILSGQADAAIATGSEAASKFMRSEFFEAESETKVDDLKKNPMVAFEHDFLRWMLSDGAGAFYLSSQPVAGKTNFRINWIEGRSYANMQPTCMFAGGHRENDGSITGWKDLCLNGDPMKQNFAMNFSQDIRQLRDNIVEFTLERPLGSIKKKHALRPGDYSWFLAHFSSHYFRQTLFDGLKTLDFAIPEERWFTSLYDKGNIGSASIYVFLDDLVQQKKLQRGEKVLCYVPESARFTSYFVELEVV